MFYRHLSKRIILLNATNKPQMAQQIVKKHAKNNSVFKVGMEKLNILCSGRD